MSSKQPRKQRLARHVAPYHRRHREMSSPIDKGLREKQLSRGFMYPRAMPIRKGDRVMVVRGEGKSKSATVVAKIDRKARKVYVESFTYFKSDGTELQRPIDASNLVIINPDWSDIRRRKILNRINESVDWTDEVITEFEATEDEYEAETVGPIEEGTADADEKIDYSSMTGAELKNILKEKGLPISGKKSELIERLKGDFDDSEDSKTEETTEVDGKIDYSNMTVPELKSVLKEKGLPISGKKSELIERLQGDSNE